MSEKANSIALANRLLSEPNCDRDDDLRVLSRQLLRRAEVIERLEKRLSDLEDGTLDMVHANRDAILRKHEEAFLLVRRCLLANRPNAALEVLDALASFHPMHGESWPGWPKGVA